MGVLQAGIGKRAALIAVFACALVALVAPPAEAGTGGSTVSLGKAGGLEYRLARFEGILTQARQSTDCDGDAELAGGGGSISGRSANARLNETYPDETTGESWAVEGGTTGTRRRALSAFAICGAVDVDFQSAAGNPPAGSVTHHPVPCPVSTDPVSGGVSATGPGLSFPTTVAQLPPSTTAWFTTYENTGANDTVTAAFAGCAGGLDVRYRSGATKKVKPGETGKAIAPCRRGEHVLGGGLNPTFPTKVGPVGVLDAWTMTTKPWDSDDRRRVPDDGWLARSYNDSTGKFKLNAFAACKH